MSTLTVWKRGRDMNGWACSQCAREFDHGDRRRCLTFARLVTHKIIRHRRVPTSVTGTSTTWTWSKFTSETGSAS